MCMCLLLLWACILTRNSIIIFLLSALIRYVTGFLCVFYLNSLGTGTNSLILALYSLLFLVNQLLYNTNIV